MYPLSRVWAYTFNILLLLLITIKSIDWFPLFVSQFRFSFLILFLLVLLKINPECKWFLTFEEVSIRDSEFYFLNDLFYHLFQSEFQKINITYVILFLIKPRLFLLTLTQVTIVAQLFFYFSNLAISLMIR